MMNIIERSEEISVRSRQLCLLWWRVLRLAYRRMSQGVSAIMASSIAFYALVALAPLALLSAWALQPVFGPGTDTRAWLQAMVSRVAGEPAGAIMQQINAFILAPQPHAARVISIAVLIWAGLRLFEALDLSLSEVWPGSVMRGFFKRKLMALASMVVAGALLVLSILTNAVLPTVIAWIIRLPLVRPSDVVLQPGIRLIAELFIAFAAFFLLFKFVPAQHVPTKVAVVGAVFTTLVWRAASPLFTWVIARSAEHNPTHGGLASVVIFLTWAFFGARVLLAGAHFAAAYDHVFYRHAPQHTDEIFVRFRGATIELETDSDTC